MADSDSDQLTQVWRATQARLPAGWALEGLRCASTGLEAEQRSDEWVAVASGPSGEQRTHRSHDPLAALTGLARGIEAIEDA